MSTSGKYIAFRRNIRDIREHIRDCLLIFIYFSVSSAATNRNRSMFGRLSDSETDSDLMLDDEEDSNIMASDGELSTSRAEKLGSIHSDSDNS